MMFITIKRNARRDFFQKLDEKHLANQLKDIAATVRGEQVARTSPSIRAFEEVKTRVTPSSSSSSSSSSRDFSLDEDPDAKSPWSRFESFNKTRKPIWQDTTHAEAVTLQKLYMEKKCADNKIRWLKEHRASTPTGDAENYIQELKRARKEDEKESPEKRKDWEEMKWDAMEDETKRLIYQSRARNKIRLEKVENNKILKSATPSIGGVTTDPIKQHVYRRNVRLNSMLCSHVEQFLTMNSSQILHEMLEGASVSIVWINSDGPRAVHYVYFQVASLPPGRNKEWVEDRMNTLAPKLRFQIAQKLQLGYTPELRFKIVHHAVKSQSRQRLFRIAKKIQNQKAQGLLFNWVSEMNWGNSG